MYTLVNWMCYICVSFLVLEVMIFMCKDVIKMSKNNKKGKATSVGNTKIKVNTPVYIEKIAK